MCNKVLIKTIDDAINFKIYLRLSSKAMANRKKCETDGNTKFEYLENEKSFQDETSIFDNYLRAISC